MYKRRKSGDNWSAWVQMATTSDNVASATKLATGRTLKVNLASTAASTTFNGTANITDIGVSGTLPIANGGTGQTTAQNACYTFLNALGTATAAPIDNTYYITQDINGGATYHRRPVSSLWTYIKGKTDSLYASSSHTHTYYAINSQGTKDPETGRTSARGGVYTYNTMSTSSGGAASYTSVIGFGNGTAGTVEIAGEWTSPYKLFVRSLRDCIEDWTAWKEVCTGLSFSLSGTTLTITKS